MRENNHDAIGYFRADLGIPENGVGKGGGGSVAPVREKR